MAPAGDGRVFVLQRTGQLRIVENGTLLAAPALNLASSVEFPDFTASAQEHGLIGATLDPGFASNGYVYVHYNKAVSGGTANRVSRFTMVGNTIDPDSEVEVITLPWNNLNGHVGGGIQFGSDGKLYVAVGDRNKYDPISTAPPSTPTFGAVLRLNPLLPNGTFVDGMMIPVDNPTSGSPVFVNGLRNPYGLAVNQATGLMLINDAGENTWEEINAVAFGSGLGAAPGANFGWPNCEGSFDFVPFPGFSNLTPCSSLGATLPIHSYASNGTGDCAITGGAFYQGTYLFADFCSGKLRQMTLETTPTVSTFFTVASFGPSALATSADGLGVYYLDRRNGTLGFLTEVPEPATLFSMAAALALLLRQTRFQFRPARVKRFHFRLRRS